MDIENAYFKTINEMAVLCQLHQTMSYEQIVKTSETVNSWFSQLPPDVIERYKLFLRDSIEREKTRGAYARASALDDQAFVLSLYEDQE